MEVNFLEGPHGLAKDCPKGTFFFDRDRKALTINGSILTQGIYVEDIVKVSNLTGTYFQAKYDSLQDNFVHTYYIVNDTESNYILTSEANFINAKTLYTGDLLFFGKIKIKGQFYKVAHVFSKQTSQIITSGKGEWGSITGNIINQTDLQQVLNSIINDCSQSAQQLRNALDEMSSNLQEQDSQLEEQWMLLNQYQLTLEQHRLKIAELETTVNSGIQIDAITHSFIPYSRWVILTKPDAQDRPTDTSKLRKNVIYYVYDDEDYDILFTVDADRGILTLSGCTVDGDTLIIPYSAQIQVVNDGTTLRLSKA